MKIGFFTDTYYPQKNGVATSVGYLAQGLRKKGHQVQIVAPKIKGYTDQDSNVLRIPSIRAWPTIPDAVRLPTLIPHRVWWKIFRMDLDIIHAHGNGLFSLIALAVAKRKKVPFILTFHTIFSHYTHYFLKGKVISPKTVNKALKIFGNLCDGITTPSEKMRQELINMGVKKPINVIPNFVDPDKFKVGKNGFLHDQCQIPKSHLILLSVGRLGKEKNFEFIIECFQKLAQKFGGVHLVIVGEGLDSRHLEKMSKNFGLEKRIHFTGGIDINLMPYVYKDADIFVFASTTETQGLCVLEAAVSGLPLAIVNDPAYEGMIKHNKNGFSLPLNTEVFAEKILSLLKNSPMRKNFGEASRKIAAKNVDQEIIISKLTKLYQYQIDSFDKKA